MRRYTPPSLSPVYLLRLFRRHLNSRLHFGIDLDSEANFNSHFTFSSGFHFGLVFFLFFPFSHSDFSNIFPLPVILTGQILIHFSVFLILSILSIILSTILILISLLFICL